MKMLTPPDAFQILSESWYNRDYDVTEVPIRSGDFVVDLGANHGYFACYAASKSAHVLAIEPARNNYEILCKNVQMNGLDGQVDCLRLAVGSEEKEVFLYHFGRYAGALYTIHRGYAQRNSGQNLSSLSSELVFQKTLASILENYPFQTLRILKMDVEGMELEILKSLPAELANRIDCIIMEYHYIYDLKEVFAVAANFGYFEISLANQLPWAARQIIRLVNKRVWKSIRNFDYDNN